MIEKSYSEARTLVHLFRGSTGKVILSLPTKEEELQNTWQSDAYPWATTLVNTVQPRVSHSII
jgi:hypothetical protein